jgi:hypothetical protein
MTPGGWGAAGHVRKFGQTGSRGRSRPRPGLRRLIAREQVGNRNKAHFKTGGRARLSSAAANVGANHHILTNAAAQWGHRALPALPVLGP